MTAWFFWRQKLGESLENERKKKKHKKSKKKKSDHCTLFCYFKLTVLSKKYFFYKNYILGYNNLNESIFLANQSASYYPQSLLLTSKLHDVRELEICRHWNQSLNCYQLDKKLGTINKVLIACGTKKTMNKTYYKLRFAWF